MSSRRTYLGVFLLFLLVGISVLAWWQYQELIKLRAQVASDDSAALRKRVADLEKRLWAVQDQTAATHRKGARDAATAVDGARPENAAGTMMRGPAERFRAAMNNPEFMKLMAMQQKARLDSTYAALFKNLTQSLNLTPQQLDQFKNLLVQKQQALMDAVQAAREQGVSPRTDPDSFKAAVSDAQDSVNQQIQAALGAAGYAQYEQYEQTLPQRNTVNQVQQALSYTQTPLTDAQSSQLIQILAQDQSQKSGDGSGTNLRALLGGGGATSPVTTQALTDAQGILSGPQVQALQQVQQTQQAQAQMMQLMRASRQGATGSAPAAAPKAGGG